MLARRPSSILIAFFTILPSVIPRTSNATSIAEPPTGQSSYTLTASPSQVSPGGQLTVSWTAPTGRPSTDWIALYKIGDPNTTYGSWQYTQGATSGNFTVTAPSTANRYEFRYLLQNGYTSVASSNIVPITVAPTVSITSPSNNASICIAGNGHNKRLSIRQRRLRQQSGVLSRQHKARGRRQ